MDRRPWAHARGEYAEQLVCDYFCARAHRVLFHQKKIFGVEFDWIFVGPRGLVYVEVKSVKSTDFYLQRWPLRQKQRFTRVAALLAEKQQAHFFLAMVDYSDKVHLFKVGRDL